MAIVQRKVYAPTIDTVAIEVGELALLKVVVPGPPTCDHIPVPTLAVLPVSVVIVLDHALRNVTA